MSGVAASIRSWPGTDPVGETRDLRRLPSVDVVLRDPAVAAAAAVHGRASVLAAVRASLAAARANLRDGTGGGARDAVAADVVARLDAAARPKVRPVFNLTGTVLHTNLGRALLAEEAVEAAVTAMRHALALEFDLDGGKRGERDAILRDLLVELTGAEDATVVNNNAAAVLLALNTLAQGREAIVSRGELIEIGGAFRMPDIMARAGARIVEVGTTNRTHARRLPRRAFPRHRADPQGPHLELPHRRLHQGGAPPPELAGIAPGPRRAARQRPRHRHARRPRALRAAARADRRRGRRRGRRPRHLLRRQAARRPAGRASSSAGGRWSSAINRNPMKRAMRIDKLRLAALEATLRLYRDPDRLAARLPTLRLLARPRPEIADLADALRPAVAAAVGPGFTVEVVDCASQFGSGALPTETIPSAGLALSPADPGSSGQAVLDLAAALRHCPVPIVGRIADGALILDLRCLEDVDGFHRTLAGLPP